MEHDTEATGVTVIGPSPVPHTARVDERRSRWESNGDGFRVGTGTLVHPVVTAGHDPGGPVEGGEILQRPHDIDDDLRVRPGDRIQGVVRMKRLSGLTRPDGDAGGSAQLVMTEDLIKDSEHDVMDGQGVERPGLAEQPIDAPGAVAFEIITAERRALHDGFELGPGPGHLIRGDGLDNRLRRQ